MEQEFYWTAKLFNSDEAKEVRYFATRSERDLYVTEHSGWKKRGKICAENLEKHLEEDGADAFEFESEKSMEIKIITSSDDLWNRVKNYAENCSWKAGKSLADNMENNIFEDWERVVVALENENICGYCTVVKNDCIPNVHYTPYIGYIFVGEKYRGNRLSQKLIQYAMDYLKSIGFKKVHIISDHENLYEKYGFYVIDRKIAPWGSEEKIYVRKL